MITLQIKALEAITARLRRLDETLRARLLDQKQQFRMAGEQLEACSVKLTQQQDSLTGLSRRIDALLSGVSTLRIDVLLGWRHQLGIEQLRLEELVSEQKHAQDALGRIEEIVATTRADIGRNDERMKESDARIARFKAQLEQEEADRQDEEAEEALGVRRLAQRSATRTRGPR